MVEVLISGPDRPWPHGVDHEIPWPS